MKNTKIILYIILALLFIMCTMGIINVITTKNKHIDFSKYQELNPQVLYSDFTDDNILFDEKYKDNYYFIEGNVYDISRHFLGGTSVILEYNYENDYSKTFEIHAELKNSDSILFGDIKKGDTVTIYGQYNYNSASVKSNEIKCFAFKSCEIYK